MEQFTCVHSCLVRCLHLRRSWFCVLPRSIWPRMRLNKISMIGPNIVGDDNSFRHFARGERTVHIHLCLSCLVLSFEYELVLCTYSFHLAEDETQPNLNDRAEHCRWREFIPTLCQRLMEQFTYVHSCPVRCLHLRRGWFCVLPRLIWPRMRLNKISMIGPSIVGDDNLFRHFARG